MSLKEQETSTVALVGFHPRVSWIGWHTV